MEIKVFWIETTLNKGETQVQDDWKPESEKKGTKKPQKNNVLN